MTNKEIKTFEKFLNERDAYGVFRSLFSFSNKARSMEFANYLKMVRPHRALDSAFNFSEMEGKSIFSQKQWTEWNHEWQELCFSANSGLADDAKAELMATSQLNNGEVEGVQEPEDEMDETPFDTDSYIIHDFSDEGRKVRQLDNDEIEISTITGFRLMINAALGEELRRLKLTKLLVREDSITKKLHLIFNKNKGVEAPESEIKANKSAMRFNSKPLVAFLISKLNIKENKAKMKISKNTARTDDFYVCEIIQ